MEVRYFAGAADAAGTTGLRLDTGPLTVAGLLERLGSADAGLAEVLAHCSLLVDGHAVRDPSETLPGTAHVDVLPPFAGG